MAERTNGTLVASTVVDKSNYGKGRIIISEETEEEMIMVEPIKGPHATVGVHCGLTLNLGNYQSAKIDVSCTLPCEPTDEAMQVAYKRAEKFASARVREGATKIREHKK